MSTNQRLFHLLKPSVDSREEVPTVNRTIEVIGDSEGPFEVRITDRDYPPQGQRLTIVPAKSYDSINAAIAEAERQVDLSLAEGFIRNKMSML